MLKSDKCVNKMWFLRVSDMFTFVFSSGRKAWNECTVNGNRDQRAMLEIAGNILVTTNIT